MVAFNRIREFDPSNVDEDPWSDDCVSCQHMRDIIVWSGMSLAIGILIGMGVMCL